MKTDCFGLIGHPVSHSLSGILHRFFLTKMNKSGTYNLFSIPPQKLPDELKHIEASGVRGVNVTIPHKQAIIPFLDQLSPQAKKIGAVNTILFEEGKRIGYNTDYDGFGLLLQKCSFEPQKKKVLLLGAGGSALAVAHYLLDHGAAEVQIASRNPGKKYQDSFSLISYPELPKKLSSYDLLINCTPIGMHPKCDECPLPPSYLDAFYGTIVDLIYNPLRTSLGREGEKRSLQVSNGLPMLVGQGFVAQEIWQKKSLNPEWLTEAEHILEKALEASYESK